MGRAYQLRGVGMRMFRGVLLLDVIRRLIEGRPDKRLRRLRGQLAQKEIEIQQLREEITKLEALLAKEGDKEESSPTG